MILGAVSLVFTCLALVFYAIWGAAMSGGLLSSLQ